MEERMITWQRLCGENLLTAVAYWELSSLTFVAFKQLGVMPMPIWPAAALAIVAAFYRSWAIAPGIAVGTVLANHFALGGSWTYSVCIAVMNTLGPLAGAAIMRRRVSRRIVIRGGTDLVICFLALMFLTPMLTATGGIGFKWLLGLTSTDAMVTGWLKWSVAHSFGTFLFATPVFTWLALREPKE